MTVGAVHAAPQSIGQRFPPTTFSASPRSNKCNAQLEFPTLSSQHGSLSKDQRETNETSAVVLFWVVSLLIPASGAFEARRTN